MLREIRLDKFPKKSNTFRPQILTNITIHQRRPYDSSTPKLTAIDTTSNLAYQLYIIRKPNQVAKQNIEFITHTANILLLEREPYSLIFEQQTNGTLKEYLSSQQTKTHQPYINETEAKEVLNSVIKSLESFEKNGIEYQCVSDHNVVRLRNDEWVLSLAAVVGDCFAGERNFFDSQKKGWEALCYAVGSLAFKMLFGFVPYEDVAKKPSTLKLASYIDFLQQSTSDKKLLKLYHFTNKIHSLSQRCRVFLQQCLSGKIITFSQLLHHAYFSFHAELPKKQYVENKQIQVLNYFDKKYHSLIMAAIQRRKKYPHEKLHPTMGSDIAGFLEVKEMAAKDSLLKFLNFAQMQVENQLQNSQEYHDMLALPEKYFETGEFDVQQHQRPTLQLIKFIERDRVKNSQLYTINNNNNDREAKVKLYAFPYTMVFELANVYHEQPVEMKKKIEQLIPLLLEVSAMHWPVERLPCLHATKLRYTKFEEIKLKYRELINTIYKHFLTEAMKRYNAKKENLTIAEKMRLKEEGLEYYRLCLKLMEVSLIVRKGGKELDLQRIETSQRKEIEQDLETILKTFFPNRVEIK